MFIMARITKADLETKISKLNDELANYRRWLSESENKYNKLADEKEAHLEELPVYQQMQKQIKLLEEIKKANEATIQHGKRTENALRNKIQELLAENRQLQESIKNQINDTVHNARGAGRKPKPEEKIQEQLQYLDKLLNDGKKEKEICRFMQVSRATYYRLKKVWKEKYH